MCYGMKHDVRVCVCSCKMTSLQVILAVMLAAIFGCVVSHPERPDLLDPGKARELFHLIEANRTNQDGKLTPAEVQEMFETFDMDGDKQVGLQEFTIVWLQKGLGNAESAGFLFGHADTNKDGVITSSPDMIRLFHIFDLNGDGAVSEMEFVVIWSSMSQ